MPSHDFFPPIQSLQIELKRMFATQRLYPQQPDIDYYCQVLERAHELNRPLFYFMDLIVNDYRLNGSKRKFKRRIEGRKKSKLRKEKHIIRQHIQHEINKEEEKIKKRRFQRYTELAFAGKYRIPQSIPLTTVYQIHNQMLLSYAISRIEQKAYNLHYTQYTIERGLYTHNFNSVNKTVKYLTKEFKIKPWEARVMIWENLGKGLIPKFHISIYRT